MNEETVYFPLLIFLVDTMEQRVVEGVEDIPNATTFRVLKTNYRIEENEEV